jgi:hypothetical protein
MKRSGKVSLLDKKMNIKNNIKNLTIRKQKKNWFEIITIWKMI